jgi:hypothetical protein
LLGTNTTTNIPSTKYSKDETIQLPRAHGAKTRRFKNQELKNVDTHEHTLGRTSPRQPTHNQKGRNIGTHAQHTWDFLQVVSLVCLGVHCATWKIPCVWGCRPDAWEIGDEDCIKLMENLPAHTSNGPWVVVPCVMGVVLMLGGSVMGLHQVLGKIANTKHIPVRGWWLRHLKRIPCVLVSF